MTSLVKLLVVFTLNFSVGFWRNNRAFSGSGEGRYERASTIVTSNRALEDWGKLFGDTPAVTAFLDRLMHHSNFIEMREKSYRLHKSSKNARLRKASAEPEIIS